MRESYSHHEWTTINEEAPSWTSSEYRWGHWDLILPYLKMSSVGETVSAPPLSPQSWLPKGLPQPLPGGLPWGPTLSQWLTARGYKLWSILILWSEQLEDRTLTVLGSLLGLAGIALSMGLWWVVQLCSPHPTSNNAQVMGFWPLLPHK